VHGILGAVALAPQLAEDEVIEAIDPAKDVDGFHPINVAGCRSARRAGACTPYGCTLLIREAVAEPAGNTR